MVNCGDGGSHARFTKGSISSSITNYCAGGGVFQLLCRLLACCVVVCVVVGRQFASVCVLRCTWDFGFPMRFPWHQALASHTPLRAIAMSGWTCYDLRHHTIRRPTPHHYHHDTMEPPKKQKKCFLRKGELRSFVFLGVRSVQFAEFPVCRCDKGSLAEFSKCVVSELLRNFHCICSGSRSRLEASLKDLQLFGQPCSLGAVVQPGWRQAGGIT